MARATHLCAALTTCAINQFSLATTRVMGGIGLIGTLGGSLGPIFAGWLRDRFDSPVAPMLIVLVAACSSAIIFAMQQSVSRTSQATQ